ncbi:FG-GAP-like repeat-containing protein [Streptomyces sp. NPDC127092]|uniref:FG-GAP-like repeat-containing protein n=1 Tax=Streptomyces sp. NPDC127092 TaxID=3347135 RepID=UPI0036501A84
MLLAPGATPAASPSLAPAVAYDPVASGAVSEEDYALQRAAATGAPYELVSARTETSDTWAQPEGGFKVHEYGTPVRLWRDRGWVTADPTLAFTEDGSVAAKATSVAVKFSGGGSMPLISGAMDGRTLSLTWPTALPKPVLAGNIATYAEVLPGVDLQLKAEIEGFSQLFVVKSAEAAKNPELAKLQFGLDTVGLSVHKDAETGSLTAKDPAGQIVFSSAAPMMWDSTSTSSAPSGATARTATATATAESATEADGGEVFEPGVGARDAQMPTELTADSLTITPDQQLLTGAETTYPVYIDPSWGYGDRQKWNWTRVYKKFPQNSYWNAKDVVRVGYENETDGLSRSFFQVDTSGLMGAQIKSATFRIKNIWSWSCEPRKVQLFLSGPINSKTSWVNQPTPVPNTPISEVNASKGWSSQCGAGNLEFDATSWMRTAAAAGKEGITLGMRAADESDTYGWKKFDPKTAVLETVYNHLPGLPSGLGTSPASRCTSGALIGNTTVSLYAKVSDKDAGNLTAVFELYEKKGIASTRVLAQNIPALKDRYATLVVPAAVTPGGDGISYSWRVKAVDADGASSGWKDAPCAFAVDRTRPESAPQIKSPRGSDGKPIYPSGESGRPAETGASRTEATFTFDPNGAQDVQKIYWWTDTDPDLKEAQFAGGVHSGLVKITSAGPHLIYAYSVDGAGNRSDTATYLYYAATSILGDELGDLNGDGYKDIWSPNSNGTLLAYAGAGNRHFSTINGTLGGVTFPEQQIAFSGDWGEDGYNDLVALVANPDNEGRKDLRVYANTSEGVLEDASPLTLRVRCPEVVENTTCHYPDEPDWKGDNHWKDADQIQTGDYNADGKPDILVKQGQRLWFYKGNRSVRLNDANGRPTLVGGFDWDRFTIISSGDINGDMLPDLLLREETSGDLYRSYGTADPASVDASVKTVNFATWGSARVKIGTGFKKSDYPQLGTSGDLDGDGIIDLWARKVDDGMVGWPGTGTPTALTGFGTQFVIDGVVGGIRLVVGTVLQAGQSVVSQSAKLTMGADGNLSITSTKSGKKLWATTGGRVGTIARVQENGNIAGYAGSDKVWDTNAYNPAAGYALLQDSGDLVVYDEKNQSLWSSGTGIRHDYNASGRSGMTAWYDYADGSDAVHTFAANSDGTFQAPRNVWSAATGNYYAENMKRLTGDYNGDGLGDVAAMYGYSDGGVAMITWIGKGDGTFAAPVKSWQVPSGHWTFARMTPHSGDFNGDGRDDIAVWYDYYDKSDTIFTFTSTVQGTFNRPVTSWNRFTGWEKARAKTVTGDFNADGRDDIAVMYGYADGSEKLWTFSSTTAGTFTESSSWSSTTWGDFNRTTLHAGDFNGDGRDDIAAWYDYADGHDAVFVWPSAETGSFATGYEAWTAPAGSMWRENIKLVTGDYNGDGRDDLGALYGYSDGSVRMFTWTSNTSNKFDGPTGSWYAAPNNWTFNRVTFFEYQL